MILANFSQQFQIPKLILAKPKSSLNVFFCELLQTFKFFKIFIIFGEFVFRKHSTIQWQSIYYQLSTLFDNSILLPKSWNFCNNRKTIAKWILAKKYSYLIRNLYLLNALFVWYVKKLWKSWQETFLKLFKTYIYKNDSGLEYVCWLYFNSLFTHL